MVSEPAQSGGHRAVKPETQASILLKNISWKDFVQKIQFPDSFPFWLNEGIKMMVVFVLTSH